MDNLKWCIDYLLKYNKIDKFLSVYTFDSLRALMNITMPYDLENEFYIRQDEVILSELNKYELQDTKKFQYKNNIFIYQGDITKLIVDAIVNACNERLLGCFYPLHSCVDNIIHSYAGLEVRRDLLKKIGDNYEEENVKCIVTNAYNLKAKYIFHTVGPNVTKLSEQDKLDLKNCYLSSLEEASRLGLNTIAFPCISTGLYNFPKDIASSIAYKTAFNYLKDHPNLNVIFSTYDMKDYLLYKKEENKYDY